ncbi:notch-regulated ankyrin repeat-containing protein A-like [Diadema antillarum]|uniref:notch-regulated ankyrin repeat-containing protein A-like n=1 Tax=Diadema antillarum TaxID=105358 RepID=UPI003A83CDD6
MEFTSEYDTSVQGVTPATPMHGAPTSPIVGATAGPLHGDGRQHQLLFHEAVQLENYAELGRLLRASPPARLDVNIFDRHGQTPLHQSVLKGNLEMVKLLVHCGADVALANREGWNALHIAAYRGYIDIALYLIGGTESYKKR